MARYRKKPVEIDAVQWDGLYSPELDNWITCKHIFVASPERMSLHIETLEGSMVAQPGDFIIKGVQGEFYPCREDIFRATYEQVTD